MRFYTHLAFGFLLALLFFPHQPLLIMLFLFFSVFPDIDIATSKLGKHAKLIPFLFEHRTFFHSPLLLIFIFIITKLLFTTEIALAASLGFLSHLVLDQLNYKGIPWLFPLNWRIKGFCKSGGIIDHLLVLLFIALSFFLYLS